jgi:hypothetical protein
MQKLLAPLMLLGAIALLPARAQAQFQPPTTLPQQLPPGTVMPVPPIAQLPPGIIPPPPLRPPPGSWNGGWRWDPRWNEWRWNDDPRWQDPGHWWNGRWHVRRQPRRW